MDRLPALLMKRVSILLPRPGTNNKGVVYLLGSAHVSRRSVEDTKALIEAIKPRKVFIELCSDREAMLVSDDEAKENANKKKEVPVSFVQEAYLHRKKGGNLFSLAVSSITKLIADYLGEDVGEEFRVAYVKAKEIDAELYLGDRRVGITISRVWQAFTFSEKLGLAFKVAKMTWQDFRSGGADGKGTTKEQFAEDIDRLVTDKDKLADATKEVFDLHPWLHRSLLVERDVYMGIFLKRIMHNASIMQHQHKNGEGEGEGEVEGGGMQEREQSFDCVAIVGAAHVEGIQREWAMMRSIDEEQQLIKTISSYPGDGSGYSLAELQSYKNDFCRDTS